MLKQVSEIALIGNSNFLGNGANGAFVTPARLDYQLPTRIYGLSRLRLQSQKPVWGAEMPHRSRDSEAGGGGRWVLSVNTPPVEFFSKFRGRKDVPRGSTRLPGSE